MECNRFFPTGFLSMHILFPALLSSAGLHISMPLSFSAFELAFVVFLNCLQNYPSKCSLCTFLGRNPYLHPSLKDNPTVFHDIFVHSESASGEKVNAKQKEASAGSCYEQSLYTFGMEWKWVSLSPSLSLSVCVCLSSFVSGSVVCCKVMLLFPGQLYLLHVCRLLLLKSSR